MADARRGARAGRKAAGDAGRAARDAATGAATDAATSPWVDRLGRAGLIAKGVLYLIVAVIAVQMAAGQREGAADQQGALSTIAAQPFGRALLVLVAIGLAGYALWRLAQAWLGTGEPDRRKAAVERVGFLVRVAVYASLCVFTVRLIAGSGAAQQTSESGATARLLGLPVGVAVVVALGLVVVAVGLYQGYQGVTRAFLDDLRTGEMTADQRRWVTWLGVAGLVARMVVFTLIGVFLIRAALAFDPNQAVGLDGALNAVARQAYGRVLLGVVALGLAAYGVFCLVQARFARVRALS